MTKPNPASPHGFPPPGPQQPAPPHQQPSHPLQQPPNTQQRPAKEKPRGGVFASGVAVLALVLAAVAMVFAWRADSKATDALNKPAAGAPATQATADTVPTTAATDNPTAGPTDTESNAPDPGSTAADGSPLLTRETKYETDYAPKQLKLPADCNASIYVDVDGPTVRAESAVADFYYSKSCSDGSAGYINLSQGVTGTEATSSAIKPFDCNEQIATQPLADENQPIRQGQTFCIKTDWHAAKASAGTWRMAVFSVDKVATDGTVTLTIKAWKIPY